VEINFYFSGKKYLYTSKKRPVAELPDCTGENVARKL
jgi:hypothetical protein